MSASKLQKQLIRELTANPKKAGALGLLAAVALYFWLPLLFGGESKKKKKTADAAPVAQPGATASTPSSAVTSATQKRHKWQDVVSWIEQDPLMTPPKEVPTAHKAFGAEKVAVHQAEDKPETPVEVANTEPTEADVTPETLGLVLNGTLVGSNRRVALINNRPCRVGTKFWVGDDIGFVVVAVTSRSATLQRTDVPYPAPSYELTIEDGPDHGLFELRETTTHQTPAAGKALDTL